jgi:Arc/MetJ-type ribon-helix-helix transcriptional regulator
MEENNTMRIIFRPTKEIEERLDKLMETGRWKYKSELIRYVMRKGLFVVEKEK